VLERRLWISAYVFGLLCPLAVIALAPRHSEPMIAFIIAVGFVAYMGIALQIMLASRIPVFAQPIGVDLLLRFHRYMGGVTVVLVLIHVVVSYITQGWARSWIFPPPIHGPLVAQFGFAALVAMIGLGVTSFWRPPWMSYETWRLTHLVLTVIAITGAYGHVLQASDLSSLVLVRVLATLAFVGSGIATGVNASVIL